MGICEDFGFLDGMTGMLKILEPEAKIKCSICGQANRRLRFRTFRRIFGIFVWYWRNDVTGYMCIGCSKKYMVKYTLIFIPSILFVGLIIFGPSIFVSNLYNLIAGRFRIDEFDRQMLLSEEDISIEDVDLHSLYASRFKNLGDNFWSSQAYENAAVAYSKAIYFGSKEIEAYLNYARYWYEQKKFDDAHNICNIAIELKSDSAEAYLLRGLVLCNAKDPTQALNDFNRAEELGSDAPELYFNRSILLESTGEVSKAISDIETVLEKTSEGKIRKDAEKRLRKLRK